jgi:hypothetical protein
MVCINNRTVLLSSILILLSNAFVFDAQRRVGTIIRKKPTTSRALYFNHKNEGNYDNKPSWWMDAEVDLPKEESMIIKKEKNRFAQGQELKELRSDIQKMKQNLQLSLATDDLMRVVALTKSIERAEKNDPELVYSRALQMIAGANQYNTRKKYEIITHYNQEARAARAYIPRLNMDGLWVAK